jgi:hypothetical protein
VAEPTNRYQTEYAAYAAARAAGESSGRAAEPTAADWERVETIIMAWPSGVGLADEPEGPPPAGAEAGAAMTIEHAPFLESNVPATPPEWPTVTLYRDRLERFRGEYLALVTFAAAVCGVDVRELNSLHLAAHYFKMARRKREPRATT